MQEESKKQVGGWNETVFSTQKKKNEIRKKKKLDAIYIYIYLYARFEGDQFYARVIS